jgi:hypothetical protein
MVGLSLSTLALCCGYFIWFNEEKVQWFTSFLQRTFARVLVGRPGPVHEGQPEDNGSDGDGESNFDDDPALDINTVGLSV